MDLINAILADPNPLDQGKMASITDCLRKQAANDPERAHALQIKVYEKFILDIVSGEYTISSMQIIAKQVSALKRIDFQRHY